jgi:multidrug efflux pump subunit AcrA (membrane-fusion protein)
MSNQLQASQVKWKRLRKLVLTALFIGGTGGFVIYALGGGSLMLDADGLVTRQTVAVASPWLDARIREISVRPGDWVEAGQKIAVVDSAAMSRSLADLAAEQARVTGRVAQLEGAARSGEGPSPDGEGRRRGYERVREHAAEGKLERPRPDPLVAADVDRPGPGDG